MTETFVATMDTILVQYSAVHLYLVIGVCIFGISASLMNVLVLTRRCMRSTSINIILCGLSLAQLLLLVNYLIYTVYHKILDKECAFQLKIFGWMVYIFINGNLNIILHTIALVHTTLLAIFRYIAIHFPNKRMVTIPRVRTAVLLTYLCVPLLCTPIYLNSKLMEISLTNCTNWDPKWPKTYRVTYRDWPGLVKYNFWFFGVICKILPCLCLAVLSLLLIVDLRKVDKRRKIRRQNSSSPRTTSYHQTKKVSLMLLIIVFLFIAVEFPHGVLTICAGIKGFSFRKRIYQPLGDLLNMLTLLYSSINFVLYCTMSRQFRQTFCQIFVHRRCSGGPRNYLETRVNNTYSDYRSVVLVTRTRLAKGENGESEQVKLIFDNMI